MLFGLPWYAIVAIVAIGGGLLYAYKEQELLAEEKRYTSSKESQELRKLILNLKSRIEHLETIMSEKDEPARNISMDDVEIKNDGNDSGSKGRSKA